jgi:hypothetical protein
MRILLRPSTQLGAGLYKKRSYQPGGYIRTHNAAFLCNSMEVNDQTGCREEPYLLQQNYPLDLILNNQRNALDYHSNLLESFKQYGEAVTRYRQRDLTFTSDMLNAFGGMLGLMQDHLGGDIIGGMPEPLIDIGLLWGHLAGLERLSGFPSWSWAGWEHIFGRVEPIRYGRGLGSSILHKERGERNRICSGMGCFSFAESGFSHDKWSKPVSRGYSTLLLRFLGPSRQLLLHQHLS